MKRVLIAALLLLSLLPCVSLAGNTPEQAFLDLLEEQEISCTVTPAGVGHVISIQLADSVTGLDYTVQISFDPSGESVLLCVPELIMFDEAQLTPVIRACNTLNCTFLYARFIAEEEDCTVSASIDLLLGRHDAAETVLEAFERLQYILEEAYPELAPYSI